MKIQSESVNRSDIAELIFKGEILYLSKKIVIKRISTEDDEKFMRLERQN